MGRDRKLSDFDLDKTSIWEFHAREGKTPGRGKTPMGGKTPLSRFHSRFQPYSRRISFQPEDLQVDLEDEQHHDKITSEFSDQTWKICRVSPLFNFDYEQTSLNTWSQSLEADFHRVKSFRSELRDYQKISVNIEIFEGLRGCNLDDKAIKIEITTRKGKTKLLKAFLLSVNSQEKMELEDENIVILPVLLASGSETLLAALKNNLQKCFDCVVSSILLDQGEMKWATALWISLTENVNPDAVIHETFVRFNYNLGHGFKNFEIKFKQSQLLNLWNSIHNCSENNATSSEVDAMHEALTQHIFKSVGLDLSSIDLIAIEMPIATLKAKGLLHIETRRHVKTILRFITDSCQNPLESIRPRIGISSGDTIMD